MGAAPAPISLWDEPSTLAAPVTEHSVTQSLLWDKQENTSSKAVGGFADQETFGECHRFEI